MKEDTYSLLCQGDRDSIEWLLDKAVAGGEEPARPRPAMFAPISVAARLSEAIAALCDAMANATPGWRWRLTDAVQMQLACEADYLRMCGDGQYAVVPFLDDEFDPFVPSIASGAADAQKRGQHWSDPPWALRDLLRGAPVLTR